jgi:hypothetical protein
MTKRQPTALAAVACATLASTAFAACGGSGISSATNASSDANNEQQLVDFSRCMREHGVEASASESPSGGGVNLKVTATPGAPGTGQQTVEAAQKACRRYLPNGGIPPKLSPAEEAARAEQVQKFARCMRSHGVEVQTEVNGARVGIRIRDVDPQSPTFVAAQKACQGLMPIKHGPGGGPGLATKGRGPGGEAGSLAAGG